MRVNSWRRRTVCAVHARALDDLDPAPELGVAYLVEQELGAADDGGEHVVEVVGHA
jgi:hypothetical protein